MNWGFVGRSQRAVRIGGSWAAVGLVVEFVGFQQIYCILGDILGRTNVVSVYQPVTRC